MLKPSDLPDNLKPMVLTAMRRQLGEAKYNEMLITVGEDGIVNHWLAGNGSLINDGFQDRYARLYDPIWSPDNVVSQPYDTSRWPKFLQDLIKDPNFPMIICWIVGNILLAALAYLGSGLLSYFEYLLNHFR